MREALWRRIDFDGPKRAAMEGVETFKTLEWRCVSSAIPVLSACAG